MATGCGLCRPGPLYGDHVHALRTGVVMYHLAGHVTSASSRPRAQDVDSAIQHVQLGSEAVPDARIPPLLQLLVDDLGSLEKGGA
jgi:hypothetical protein